MDRHSTIAFQYETNGARSFRKVVSWSEVGRYIRGIDLSDNRIKTFRKDRVVAYEDGAESALADPYPPPPSLPLTDIQARKRSDDRPHIIFTGFARAQRATLEDLATDAGLRVCATVTKSCLYLVAGPNAGPTKVERARELSAYILHEPAFLALLATGELPDEVDSLSGDF